MSRWLEWLATNSTGMLERVEQLGADHAVVHVVDHRAEAEGELARAALAYLQRAQETSMFR